MNQKHTGGPFPRWLYNMGAHSIVRIRVVLKQERLFLTPPEAIKEVFVTKTYEFVKPSNAGFLFRRFLGNGFLLLRRMSTRSLSPILAESRQSAEAILKASIPAPGNDSESIAPQLAYDWASRSTLGMCYDFNSMGNPDKSAVKVYRKLFENEPPQFRWTVWVILEAKKGAAAIRAFAHEEVSKKGQRHGKVRYINMLTSFPSPRHQRCLLTRELVDQIMTFLAAGHETTASALTWAVYQMCTYPELQECLRKEICTKLPSIRDIDSKVTSLEVDRQASIPQRLPVHPEGTGVFISHWATTTGGARSNFANITFIHGPKSSIGKDFARSELLYLLAAWVGRFAMEWESGEPIPMTIRGWVTVRPDHKLPVVFKELPGW
ncbi:hypothetical protein M433DRAFT_141647 [Acidomyces richmondensis BFW]|nr:hypothetical protein M433DRAFT_141647 [Acidomyces richmondensis BFW]